MTIIKTKNSIETYRAISKSKNINDITGRPGRSDLTKFITSQMVKKIKVNTNSTIVDIGCGDASYLINATNNLSKKFKGKLIGFLPTKEEVLKVKNYLKKNQPIKKKLISIRVGSIKKTNLSSSYCDIVICNGVLNLAGMTMLDLKEALSEFCRITKKRGKLYIGEMPDKNELEGKNYDDSILKWLWWVLKNEGLKSFFSRVKQVFFALISNEPLIIYPKKLNVFMKPIKFIKLASKYGFKIKEYYKHRQINTKGKKFTSKSRWNYLFFKK